MGFTCSNTPLALWFTAISKKTSGLARADQISGAKKQVEIGEVKATSRNYVFMKMYCKGRMGYRIIARVGSRMDEVCVCRREIVQNMNMLREKPN